MRRELDTQHEVIVHYPYTRNIWQKAASPPHMVQSYSQMAPMCTLPA